MMARNTGCIFMWAMILVAFPSLTYATNCGRNTEVTIRVKVSLYERSIKSSYRHTMNIVSSSSFHKAYESLSKSANFSASAGIEGYGGFSSALQMSFNRVTQEVDSSNNYQKSVETLKDDFQPGMLQIYRRTRTTVMIGNKISKIEENDYVDSVPLNQSLSVHQLRTMEVDHLRHHFGHTNKGRIEGSTYVEVSCFYPGN